MVRRERISSRAAKWMGFSAKLGTPVTEGKEAGLLSRTTDVAGEYSNYGGEFQNRNNWPVVNAEAREIALTLLLVFKKGGSNSTK